MPFNLYVVNFVWETYEEEAGSINLIILFCEDVSNAGW